MRTRTLEQLAVISALVGATAITGCGDDDPIESLPSDGLGGDGVGKATQAATWSNNEVTGEISTMTTTQTNRCLYDPVGAVRSLRQRGEYFGFNPPSGGFGVGYPEPTQGDLDPLPIDWPEWHWQGVQRVPPVFRPNPKGGPFVRDDSASRYMIVTSSQPHYDADEPHLTGPHFAVVHMGSREAGGERWRSPRLGVGKPDWEWEPWAADQLIFNTHAEWIDASRAYNHVSSIQVLGDYLFVPMESLSGSWPASHCDDEPTGECQARVHVYDLSGLRDPFSSGDEPKFQFHVRTRLQGASAVAVARLAPIKGETASRILMVVAGGEGGSRELEVYVTAPGATLETNSNPFTRIAVLDLFSEALDEVGEHPWRQGWSDYQNINLVTACETLTSKTPGGQLYLLGLSRRDGDDVVDAFELNVMKSSSTWTAHLLTDGSTDGPTASRHLYCDQADFEGENQCHFDAGAGAYVDPAGRLLVYAVEHDDDGPLGSVKMMEFRPEDHLDEPGTPAVEACADVEDSFVELYDNKLHKNDGSQPNGFLPDLSNPLVPPDSCCQGKARGGYPSSRVGLMIDWVDRHARSYDDLDLAYGFSGETDAARWCLPPTHKYVAFLAAGYSGVNGYQELVGNGQIRGYNYSGEQDIRSGCFMLTGTVVDTSGASNLPSCL